jgi:tRNA A-37 threonylcarbamoyl transferase component Bud32/tetratricopeptide (TPR) repeat protein
VKNRPPSGDGEFHGTDRFRVERKLGAGGMGVVYQVRDREKRVSVALKTIRNLNAETVHRFKQEFRALQDVQHANLVSFGELHEEAGQLFFTMELVEGVDFLAYVCPGAIYTALPSTYPLSDVSPTNESTDSPPPLANPYHEERLRSSLGQLAEGIAALHAAGKIHRDIKPPNIRITPEGRVVLLDFGLVADAHITDSSEHIVGTTAYMAPEQAAALPVRPEADWYSVGVILYQALTGRLPFMGSALKVMMEKQSCEPPPPRYWSPSVPEDLEKLARGLLRRDPKARFGAREILTLLGKSSAIAEARNTTSSSVTMTPPFVGRATELAQLHAAYEASRRGHAHTAVIEGESGVGKTALVAHFTEALEGREPRPLVLRGRCYEREALSYKAFDGVIEALTRVLRAMDPVDAALLVGHEAGLAARVFPVLRKVAAVRQASSPAEIPNPQELRTRAFAALREVFRRLAERFAVVVCIDDLQWADADSLTLLGELLREPGAPPMLLLATLRHANGTTGTSVAKVADAGEAGADASSGSGLRATRDGASAVLARLGDVQRIRVGSLPADEARQLAQVLCRRTGVASAVDEAALAQEAGGHPLFLNELVRYAAIVGVPAAGQVRLDDALYARVERLDPASRRLLDTVCVAGAPIPLNAATTAAALDGADLVRCTSLLRIAMLARSTGTRADDSIEAFHDRVRESVLGHIDAATRRSIHARLADALEASDPTLQDPHLMVRHLTAAGMTVKAALQAERAARRAADTLAFDRAAEFYRTALELGRHQDAERRRLQIALGNALRDAGRCAEAADAYLLAADAPEAAVRMEVRLLAAGQMLVVGQVDRGLGEMRAVLAEVGLDLPETPRRALLSLMWWRARLRLRGLGWHEQDPGDIAPQALRQLQIYKVLSMGLGLADVTRGLGFQARGLLLALKVGHRAHVARAFGFEAVYHAQRGASRRPRALELLANTRRISESDDDPFLVAWGEGMTGAVDCFTGEFASAASRLREAELTFREQTTASTWEINHVRFLLLLALRNMGLYAETGRRIDEYLRDADSRGDRWVKVMMTRSFVSVWLARDQPVRAREALERAPGPPRRGPFVEIQEWSALRAQAEIDLYEGVGARTRARIRSELEAIGRSLLVRAQIIRTEYDWCTGRLAVAEAVAEGGAGGTKASARALAEAARCARSLERQGVTYGRGWARLLRAAIVLQRGGTEARDEAAEHLREAVVACEEASLALCAAVARRRLGELIGGAEGAAQVAAADARMGREGIVDCVRMSRLVAPGFGT